MPVLRVIGARDSHSLLHGNALSPACLLDYDGDDDYSFSLLPCLVVPRHDHDHEFFRLVCLLSDSILH
jgi:hypothetical protein